MTTTLTPELTKIYSNIIINTFNRFNPNHIPKGEYDFPVAEKRDDDLEDRPFYGNNNSRERYRYMRAADLVIEYLQAKVINMETEHCLYEDLEIFYGALNKCGQDIDFKSKLHESLNEKVWRWGLEHVIYGIGYAFDINIPNFFTIRSFPKNATEKMLNREYKRHIELILNINANMFKRDGRVYPDEAQLNKLNLEQKEYYKKLAKDILKSKDMWQAFCSSSLYVFYRDAVFHSHRLILQYRKHIKKWLKE